MSTGFGDIVEVYLHLYQGRKLQLPFTDERAAEVFRVSLAKYKSRQDTVIEELDISAEPRQRLSFKFDKDTSLATVAFVDKPDARQYTFKILEDEETSQDG